MQEENDLVIPGSNTVWRALKQDPDGCSEEEKDAVKFFVKVALVALEGKLKKKQLPGKGITGDIVPKEEVVSYDCPGSYLSESYVHTR